MKNKNKYNKKNLKNRLSAILTIYLDGLGKKKKAKMDKYLDEKMKDVVDYYSGLQKKKKSKHAVLPPDTTDLSIMTGENITQQKEAAEAEDNQPEVTPGAEIPAATNGKTEQEAFSN
jgi:hypothetical protein